MSIMVEEEVKIVRFESNGHAVQPVRGRDATAEEVASYLRSLQEPGVEGVLSPKMAQKLVREKLTSPSHGAVTGPFRRRVEKELQKPR